VRGFSIRQKRRKWGVFMTLAAIQEVQIEWEHKDYHSPTSLFKGMGVVKGEIWEKLLGIGY